MARADTFKYLGDKKFREDKTTRLSGRGLYWGYRVPETIGQRIAAAIQYRRAEMHLTQDAFAELCGVSYKFMGEIERGSALSIDMLERIVEKSGMKPDHFLLLAARFTTAGPPLIPLKTSRPPFKAAEVAADALEGLVGVLDGILNDFRSRLEEYHRSTAKPEK